MQNFRLAKTAVDTRRFLDELEAVPQMWLANTSRQEKVRCQRHTKNIFLRVAKKPLPPGEKNSNNVHESVKASSAKFFPNTLNFCENFAKSIDGSLGRVILVALLPNSQVFPHIDYGDYYRIRDRYHLVINSRTGSPLKSGTETVVMHEGELWMFNNKLKHSAVNESDEDRIHLIFDILPAPGCGFFTA